MNPILKIALVLFTVFTFTSCVSKKLSVQPTLTNELYIYYNGIDTVVKDYEHYKYLKHFADSAGLHLTDSINWIPKPGESSRFVYYQIINRQFVYTKFSIFMDSSIIETFKLGKNITSEKRTLTQLSTSDSIYTDVEQIVNKPESIVNTFTFTQDSLFVKMEFISNRETPIHLYDAYKYGELNFLHPPKKE